MVNGVLQSDAQGNSIFVPVPEEELSALRELVASAVGFDENRGDVITLKSLSFEPLETVGTLPMEQSWFTGNIDAMSLLQIAVLAVVALVLGLFVVRPLLLPGRQTAPVPALVSDAQTASDEAVLPVLNGTIEPDTNTTNSGLPILTSSSAQPSIPNTEDAVARLKTLIEERRNETVEVLRSWLDDPRQEDAR